jgi:hypothetical protein
MGVRVGDARWCHGSCWWEPLVARHPEGVMSHGERESGQFGPDCSVANGIGSRPAVRRARCCGTRRERPCHLVPLREGARC